MNTEAKNHPMRRAHRRVRPVGALAAAALCGARLGLRADPAGANPALAATNAPAAAPDQSFSPEQSWNWHIQNTVVLQGHGRFGSEYEGQQSMKSTSELKQTVSFDFSLGARLWQGAEFHVVPLVWQGYGLSHTFGMAAFPNNEAFKLGTEVPNITLSHAYLQQTFGFGGEQEATPDGALSLAGARDVRRLTLYAGKFSVKDVFDGNAYANDGRRQFLNWALVSQGAWDFPADSLGYITGLIAELNQADWALRYGVCQMPRVANGAAIDPKLLEGWGMVLEFERRWRLGEHPGAIRFLVYANHERMVDLEKAAEDPALIAEVNSANYSQVPYSFKYGGGISFDQEIAKSVGVFSRLGKNDGHVQTWPYTDIDESFSLGLSLKGDLWNRPEDTYGLAGVIDGISTQHRAFLAAGGMGVTVGDGALKHYGPEELIETYYDAQVWKTVHATVDYTFAANPAYNRDRGPVHIFQGRLHWEF